MTLHESPVSTENPVSGAPSRFSFVIGTPPAAKIILMIALGVVAVTVIGITVVLLQTEPSIWFIPLIPLVGIVITFIAVLRQFVTYTVDEEGFLKHGQGDSKERVLTWRDIREIKRVRGGGEAVKLLDANGKGVRLNGQLEGYENLITLLPRLRPDLWDFQGEQRYQKWGSHIFLGLLAFIFLLVGIFVGEPTNILPKVLFIGAAGFIFWLLWGDPYRLELRPGELVLTSFQGSKRYTPADIKRVWVERHRNRNSVSYVPTLDLSDGKKVGVAGFAGGSMYLYGALLRWWERGGY